MLYLAEVHKKSGFIGGGKADFKLLACQRGDVWTGVPGDESIAAPDDASYGAGALVMLEINANRQVQRHYEAGRPLVGILQNFSNQAKKSKSQEEEIDQWKQSLTFQSQELNRRELELETRQEQLEQAEADVAQLETQRQEIEKSQGEIDQLKTELDRKHEELQGAWDHLNGEVRRFEERQEEVPQGGGLDEAQIHELQNGIERLTNAVTPAEEIREQLHSSQDLINQQQSLLSEHVQALEQKQQGLDAHRSQLQQANDDLAEDWRKWHEADAILGARKVDLKSQQQVLADKQGDVQILSQQLQSQSNLYQKVYELLNTSDKVRLSDKVDVTALDAMPLEALETLVSDLGKDLEKVSRFVSDQEEELTLQKQAIDDVKQKMDQATEFDRLQLAPELDDEQDRYQMLNETLVGQRRNLLEREEVLSQHQAVLRRRQGLAAEEAPVNAVDLEPLLKQVDTLRQQTTELLQQTEASIKEMQSQVESLKQEVEQKTAEQTARQADLKQRDSELKQQQAQVGVMEGQVVLLTEMLSPLQAQADGLVQRLDSTIQSLAQFQEASDYQLQAIASVKQLVSGLAASN